MGSDAITVLPLYRPEVRCNPTARTLFPEDLGFVTDEESTMVDSAETLLMHKFDMLSLRTWIHSHQSTLWSHLQSVEHT